MASPENSATALAREIIDNTKRLAESTDALAERNSELKGIIDRSYHDFIERDLMARNLVVCRQVSELERVILQKALELKLQHINTSYLDLRDDIGVELPFEEGNIYEHLEDIFDGHLFDLQLRLTHLQKENEGLKDELEETRHTISKLDAVQRKQLDVATEAGTMASKFREISENALSAFNDHFNTATDGARENFKDLQLTLREQAKDIDDEDSAAVARMMAFSEHVRDLGEVPLDKMILNVQNLVATTEEDFLDMQDDLDQFASSAKQAAEGTLTATKTSMSSRKDRKKYRSSDMDTLVEFPCSDSDQASQDTRTSTPIHHENEGIRYESGQYCVYRAQHH